MPHVSRREMRARIARCPAVALEKNHRISFAPKMEIAPSVEQGKFFVTEVGRLSLPNSHDVDKHAGLDRLTGGCPNDKNPVCGTLRKC